MGPLVGLGGPLAAQGGSWIAVGSPCWRGGAGVRGGYAHGATDDVGLRAVHDKVHVHDLHATLLHLLGMDHERLTFRHNGLDERLTGVAGDVVHSILA